MSANQGCRVAVRASVRAVSAAVLAMAAASVAYAADPAPADPAVTALTQPTNSIEAGIGYVTQDSFKYGQFNGLFNKGAYGILNFDVRDQTPYDADSALRWRIFGTNLGLDTRSAYAEVGKQGSFRISVGFDELRSNYTDSYQTPFLGNGSNFLTLPSTWLKPVVPQANATGGNFRALSPTTGLGPTIVNGVVTQPTAAQQATVNGIIAADVPSFNNLNLDTVRKVYSEGLGFNIDPRWDVKVSASQTQQNGLKPLNMISLASGTVSAVLPNLIDQITNQYNASINYTGDKFYFTAAYYGSYFTNHNNSMTFENPFAKGTVATMSTAPSNDFNQFILKGGYNFTPTTKLVVGASYGRNTQNDPFLNNPTDLPIGLPTSSLNGLVVTEMFTARLTAKPVKNLNVGLAYTYNDRDNKTPVNTYAFYDAEEPKTGASSFNGTLGLPAGTLGSNINIYANRPYSKKVNTVVADADYLFAPGQSVKGAYEYQQIDRNCPGSWINCADATQARENTLRLAYDGNISETFSARASYAYSQRRVDYDPNAWLALVPMANFVPGAPTVGATTSAAAFLAATGLGGYGPNAPYVPLQPGNLGIFFPNNSAMPQALYGSRNDIHEIPGLMRFNMADRDRNKVRASLDWQALEALSVQAGVEYVDDNYNNSVYGLTSAKNWQVNLEATLAGDRGLQRQRLVHVPEPAVPERWTFLQRRPDHQYGDRRYPNHEHRRLGWLLLDRHGQEHERQDRPVPELERQRARPGELARPGLSTGKASWRASLISGVTRCSRGRRPATAWGAEPMRTARSPPPMYPRTPRHSSFPLRTCRTSPTIRSHCGCLPSTPSTRNPLCGSCTCTVNCTPTTMP